MTIVETISQLHTLQARHHAEVPLRDDYRDKANSWLDERTTDYWRHDRIRRCIAPLLVSRQCWLTVGDGRFGADANWLIKNGQEVLCTDIQDTTLAHAARNGTIGEYQAANAETLPFSDGSFDWALCKESYHHMPRAPLAWYELLRVTRKGVVLIEPIDSEANRWWGNFALPILNALKSRGHSYEESGNYVFSLSRRDVEKMMLGVGLTVYAFRDISDCYVPGAETETSDGPLRRRLKRSIWLRDAIKRVLGVSAQLGIFVIPHEGVALPAEFNDYPWDRHQLPANPYAKRLP